MKILFPTQYKKAISNKTKNTTIRLDDEIGKYKVGKIYKAHSYAGRDWGADIKIIKTTQTTLNKLMNFGIPKSSINRIIKENKLSGNVKVELIKFEIL